MIWIAVVFVLGLLVGSASLRWGTRWGSTSTERTRAMAGDEFFERPRGPRVVMTRAISIAAAPERVWPWMAQVGRGAGWYSVDSLDNGRKDSARHVVSWIPEPRIGDATAIGYLRHVEEGRVLAWWLDDGRFLASRVRLVACYEIRGEGKGSRLVSRISADAAGPVAHIALFAFRAIDSIMACRQLIGLRSRIEYCERSGSSLRDPETGARDQYQLYEVLYATGGRAGVAGREGGVNSRQSALRDGVLEEE